MSGSGGPAAKANGQGLHVAIVAASWHEEVMAGLIAGASRVAQAGGATTELLRVPGSFELPVVARRAADGGFDAVVALGVIIRGGTPHFDYVCSGVTQGLTQAAIQTGVPIGFGVLTCDDEAQALDRAGLPTSHEDKGAEAMAAALATVPVLQQAGATESTYAGFGPA